MNLAYLKKNVGWRMRLAPPATHFSSNGEPLPERDEDWIVQSVTDDVVELSSAAGYQLRLGTDHIVSFFTDPQRADGSLNHGILQLKVHVHIKANRITVTPNARPGERVMAPPIQEQPELIALGPRLVGEGRILSVEKSMWKVEIADLLEGDVSGLINYIEVFGSLNPNDCYVVLNTFGDGRALSAAPSFQQIGSKHVVTLPVAPSIARVDVHVLPSEFAQHPETGDMFLQGRSIARVSGINALPQRLHSTLSTIKGEAVFHPLFGSVVQSYFWRYQHSPRLNEFMKLELSRLAAIPYYDETGPRQYTPFQCVERVNDVVVVRSEIIDQSILLGVDVQVKGIGRWQGEVRVLMPPAEKLAELSSKAANYFASR